MSGSELAVGWATTPPTRVIRAKIFDFEKTINSKLCSIAFQDTVGELGTNVA